MLAKVAANKFITHVKAYCSPYVTYSVLLIHQAHSLQLPYITAISFIISSGTPIEH